MSRLLTSLFLCLFACSFAGAEIVGPELVRFEPRAEAPTPSKEPGLAPVSAKGMRFTFSCTQAFPADSDVAEKDPSAFDRSCTFRSMDRAEIEMPLEDADEEEDIHYMFIYNYVKTGSDTAVITCWNGYVYDDDRIPQGSVYELHLNFTSETDGEVQFASCGHGDEFCGCGIFTLRR